MSESDQGRLKTANASKICSVLAARLIHGLDGAIRSPRIGIRCNACASVVASPSSPVFSSRRSAGRELFAPLPHPPEYARVGFGEALGETGGGPLSILRDNTVLAAEKILADGTQKRTRIFPELQSHYLFEDRFGRPGTDKGTVGGVIGFDRLTSSFQCPASSDSRR